jgi:hypothetical protein
MTFEKILDQALAMLQRHGRVTYRTLQRQFDLDNTALEDLKDAIRFAHPQVVDEEGRGLVWPVSPADQPAPVVPPLAAQTLLKVIAHNPDAVKEALAQQL